MTTDDTPPVAEDGTPPPVAEADTSPVAEDGTPPVVEVETPPVSEVGTPGVPEVGTPPVVEDGAPVFEGDTSPVVEDETPAAAEDGLRVDQEAMPITAGSTSPVTGEIFLGAEEGTPRTSAPPRSKFATWARRLRMVVAYVLLLAVLGAAGVAAFALVQGTWEVSPILSGSMRPGLAVGGVVISQRVPVDSLHVRDVIVFADPYKPSEQVVHRIVRITKGPGGKLQFKTQGDANTVRDPWTMSVPGGYVYRARWTVPLLGYVANAYQNHRRYFLIGAGIVLILIAVSMVLGTRPGRRRRQARRATPAQLEELAVTDLDGTP
ncbi:MAG: signal peptidase I [Acidimicrobiales bacterium]|jgi:signal peptidase I